MKYELLIYAGSQVLSALDVDGDRIQYISMLGNTEHSAEDVNGFYEQLLDYYNVDNLSEIDTDIRIINSDMSQNNILFFLEKLKKIKTFSIWRIEELLPIVLINNNMIDKDKCVKVRVYDRCYAVSADEKFNVIISDADNADNELRLEDFTLFNNFNGADLKQNTVLIEQMTSTIQNLEYDNQRYQRLVRVLEEKIAVFEREKMSVQEKTSLQKEPDNYITEENYSVGNIIKLGIYEGKPIKWRILKRNSDSAYAVSEEIICNRAFDRNNINNWEYSELRKWLNSEFYTNTFDEKEKARIVKTNEDYITLLTKEEFYTLLSKEERETVSFWWLRSPGPYTVDVYYLRGNGFVTTLRAEYSSGVRPAFNLKF